MSPNIRVSFIIEILGRPPEHLKSTMELLIDKLGNENGVRIVERIVHEPKKIEEKNKVNEDKTLAKKLKRNKSIIITGEIFTTFAEIEAEFETLESLLFVAFNYMPSNIEIISPQNFILRNSDIGGLLTGIMLRLHRYDEISKKLTVDKTLLEEKLSEIAKRIDMDKRKKDQK